MIPLPRLSQGSVACRSRSSGTLIDGDAHVVAALGGSLLHIAR
jgi:hypothetical protein